MLRRGSWVIAIAMLVAVAVVMSLARPAEAADPPPTSFTFDVPLPDNWDRAMAQDLVDDLNTRHVLLSDSIKEQLDAYRADLPGAPPETWHDFDGSAAVTGSGLSFTVQVSEVQAADWAWLRDIGILLGTAVLVYLIRFFCMAAATGPLGPSAPVLCTPLGGFFGTLIGGAIRNAATGQLHNWKAWAVVLGAAVGAAILGYGWEGWLNPLVKAEGPNWMASAGAALRNLGQKIKLWAPSTGDAIASTGESMTANADDIALGIVEGVEQAGSNPTNLRVLPLGDSITYGVGTPDNSSYRARLWDLLNGKVDDLDFVGSVDTGQLPDTDNEGHPGWTISQISQIAPCTLRTYQPNVVTLHIGTNDMARSISVGSAPDRLRSLLRRIFEAAPRTTVLLATLIPSTTPATMNRIQQYNAAIPGIAAEFRATGRTVIVVDMGAVTPGDMTDSLHPNANGYRKMGDAFHRTIDEVLQKGAFSATSQADFFVDACPTPTGGSGGTTGSVDPTSSLDGWSPMGVVASGAGPREEVRFADLNGDGRDDYLLVGAQGQVRAWFNVPGGSGGVSWQSQGVVAAGSAPREEVRFADLNGDGRDDYLVVNAQGQVTGWLNVAGGSAGVSWQSQGVVATGVGATRDEVRFADINGDGRDDYLVVGAQGQVKAWFSTVGGSNGVAWVSQGEIVTGVGLPGSMITFADIDGDLRDDYLAVNDSGRIWAWRNNRGGGGSSWLTQGEIATGVGATRNQVNLADYNGDHRDDYLVVDAAGVAKAWTNNGEVRKG